MKSVIPLFFKKETSKSCQHTKKEDKERFQIIAMERKAIFDTEDQSYNKGSC